MASYLTRAVVRTSVIGAMTALSFLTLASPATAAVKTTEYTYKGYTYSWTKEDYSDVTMTYTPSKPDNLPDGVTSESVSRAHQDALRAKSIKQTSVITSAVTGGDHCTYSPDRYLWKGANYTAACDHHDYCYSSASKIDRYVCDRALAVEIISACQKAYGSVDPRRYDCSNQAPVYYAAVRKFAKSHYHGKGNPA